MLAGVADPARPPRAGRPGRGPRAEHHRGRRGHPLEAAAPRRRQPDVHRGRLPQRGAAPRLPAERDAHQPVRRARAARGLRPTWAEDSINADAASDEEAGLLEVEPGAPVLRHSRRALAGEKVVEVSRIGLPRRPVHPLGAARARRAEPGLPSAGDRVAGLLADPHRVGPAEVGLDVAARAPGRAQVRQSGQRPTVSNSASCTSWATSPATYTSPSGHCSAHHSPVGDGVLEDRDRRRRSRGRGPGGRRAPGRGRRTAGRCPRRPFASRRKAVVTASCGTAVRACAYSRSMGSRCSRSPCCTSATCRARGRAAPTGCTSSGRPATGRGAVARARARSRRSAARPTCRSSCCCGSTTPGPPPAAS